MAGYGYGGPGYAQGYGYGSQGYGYGQPRSPVPPGWAECPPIGTVSDVHKMIPMKVPLGNNRRFPDMEMRTQGQWSPLMALHEADRIIKEKDPDATVGTVLDLSNSDKYYDPMAIQSVNVRYVKVPCRGRGVSPDPLAVNMAVWEIRKALAAEPNNYILVHCTHGYNRSGFIICCAMIRLLGWAVERSLRRFQEQRAPGIYKDGYIKDLFRRHNERRLKLESCATPALPAWKPADDEDEDERLGTGQYSTTEAKAVNRLSHADKIGEPVCMEEARYVMNTVYDIIQGQDTKLKSGHLQGYPHERERHRGPGDLFIGSQPVSLDLDNLNLVKQKRYYVTWKADGTRYLLLCMREGAYFVDRSGEVRRAHMRFPTRLHAKPGQQVEFPVGPPHHWTLLDGEMVVDEVDISGEQQRRRYLVYDVMMLAGEGVSDMMFKDRWALIEQEIVRPREKEKEYFGKQFTRPGAKMLYDVGLELCSVRRKEFYPLFRARHLLFTFIPQLCHESDGLILQPAEDPYIPRTYPHLLKWKFRHMNSVDFKLHAVPGQAPALMLNCAYRRKGRQMDTNHLPLSEIGVAHATVVFPDDVDPATLHGKIVECSFDTETRVWKYMRDRPDKLTANHRSVFDKVMASIEDNITEEFLLGVFDEALGLAMYSTDAQRAQNPAALPPANVVAAQQQQQQPGKPPLPQQQQQQQQLNHQTQQPPHQQRHGTPEVLQQQRQAPQRTYRDPSPILTPPPGVDDAGSVDLPPPQQQQQEENNEPVADEYMADDLPVSNEGQHETADGLQHDDPADHQHIELQQDEDMDNGLHVADDDGRTHDMEEQQDDEDEPYHVTEQDDTMEEEF